jgi:hypothetical protein
LFPEQLPKGAEYEKLIQRVMNNEIIHDKLLSEEGNAAKDQGEQHHHSRSADAAGRLSPW